MPTSQSTTRSRLACAGLTTAAVVAALLVSPPAAFAAVTAGTVWPPVVPVSGTASLTDTAAGFTGASVVEITSAATCPATYATPGASNVSPWAPTTTRSAGNTVLTFTLPVQVARDTNGVAKAYQVCGYAGATAGTSALQSSATLYVGTPPALSTSIGLTGAPIQLGINAAVGAPIFSGVTNPGAFFTTSACPAVYGTTPALAVPVNKTNDSTASVNVPPGVTGTTATPTPYSLCFYNGTTATSTLLSAVPYSAAIALPSQPGGPNNGGNTLTVNAVNPIFTGLAVVGASFTSNPTCAANYNTTTSAGTDLTNLPVPTVRKLASNKAVAFTVPNTLNVANTQYQLCLYNGASNSSTLLASAPYATTTVPAASAVSPSSGPALGGNLITISGAAFPQAAGAISATLGGAPLGNINWVSANAFTAMAPPHAPALNAALVINTPSGQSVLTNAYSFLNSVAAYPNTGPNSAANVDVVVDGSGFLSSNWSGTLPGAHIYLVDGVYASAANLSGNRANAPVTECTSVLPLTDTELVCGLTLNQRLDAAGTAALAVPAPRAVSVATVNGSRLVTGGSGFTNLEVGMMLSGLNLPANTTIVKVLSATSAILSNDAIATGTDAGAAVIAASATRSTTATIASGAATSTAGGPFTAADNGKTIFGTNIPASTVLSASSGVATTLSNVTTGALSLAEVHIYTPLTAVPVPEGAYTVTYVSNGSVDAQATDPNYAQSTVSSSSTFTVSAF